MLLDCNAENLPKYVRGEPIWIRIPLSTTSRVESVTLRWADTSEPAFGWRIGRAIEFSLCARRFGTNSYVTNCTAVAGAGAVDVVIHVATIAGKRVLTGVREVVGFDGTQITSHEVYRPGPTGAAVYAFGWRPETVQELIDAGADEALFTRGWAA